MTVAIQDGRQAGAAVVRRGPGRPRFTAHDDAIVDAVLELLGRGEEITVARVVEVSGVSRAAIYRRWPSMTDLLAAALDRGREPFEVATEGDLLENLLHAFGDAQAPTMRNYSEDRLRLRLRLAMSDRKLARAYWTSHAERRRRGMTALLHAGIERGVLREDIDTDACIDLINGVFYYQLVVRGESLADPGVHARCVAAVRVAWQGMLAA